jgi:hypothetical protein
VNDTPRRPPPVAAGGAVAPGTVGEPGEGEGTAPEGLVRLDPADVRLRRGSLGQLQAVLPDRCLLRARLVRAFPLSRPEAWVALQQEDGQEAGLLQGLDGLDADSRQLAEEELRLRYFTPRVTAVLDLRDELQGGRSGGIVWDLMTDRGPARLHMPNTNEHIQPLGNGRLLLTDRDGQRFEIADIAALDANSRRLLRRFVWL